MKKLLKTYEELIGAVLATLVGVVAMYLFVVAMFWYATLPVMQISNTTGECVRVLTPKGTITCDKFKHQTKYKTEWVE